jgi:hypothetical protein
MNESQTVTISFDEPDQALAGGYAQELRQLILAEAPQAQVTPVRADPHSMDLGTMLTIVVTNLVIRVVFESVRVWITMHRKPIRIVVGDKVFIIDQLTPDMQAEIAKALHLSAPVDKAASG